MTERADLRDYDPGLEKPPCTPTPTKRARLGGGGGGGGGGGDSGGGGSGGGGGGSGSGAAGDHGGAGSRRSGSGSAGLPPTPTPTRYYKEAIDLTKVTLAGFPSVPGVPIDFSQDTCTHPYTRVSDLTQCCDCSAFLDEEDDADRLATERHKAREIHREDHATCGDGGKDESHAALVHRCGVSIEWLVNFTQHHDCWDWPTWKVNRCIIKPATQHARCRYAHLPKVQKYAGPADVFVSHCWGAPFGDLVMAALVGAREGRRVWVDIFAVRQWCGREADLCFESIVKLCRAVIVSVSVADELNSTTCQDATNMERLQERYRGEAQQELIRRTVSLCRLWCIVELGAAVRQEIPIVLRYGKATCHADQPVFYYRSLSVGLQLVQYLVRDLPDISQAGCSAETDQTSHLRHIKLQKGGFEGMTLDLRRALYASHQATMYKMWEVDAALCGERESLQLLMRRCRAKEVAALVRLVHALRVALLSGSMPLFSELLALAAYDDMMECLPASQNGQYRRMVWLASSLDYTDMCKLMLSCGFSGHSCGGEVGESALSIAMQNGSVIMAQLLLDHGASFEMEELLSGPDYPDKWYAPKTLREVWVGLTTEQGSGNGARANRFVANHSQFVFITPDGGSGGGGGGGGSSGSGGGGGGGGRGINCGEDDDDDYVIADEYQIRLATMDELPEVVDVINAAFQEAYRHVRPVGVAPPRTTVEKVREQCNIIGCNILMCEAAFGEKKEILGALIFPSPHDDFPATQNNEDTLSFGSLAVKPTHQRRGLGRTLMSAVEHIAMTEGKSRLELCFAHGTKLSGSPKLLEFYTNLGYEQGLRRERKEWFDILPEFRGGLYFQQMVKTLERDVKTMAGGWVETAASSGE